MIFEYTYLNGCKPITLCYCRRFWLRCRASDSLRCLNITDINLWIKPFIYTFLCIISHFVYGASLYLCSVCAERCAAWRVLSNKQELLCLYHHSICEYEEEAKNKTPATKTTHSSWTLCAHTRSHRLHRRVAAHSNVYECKYVLAVRMVKKNKRIITRYVE